MGAKKKLIAERLEYEAEETTKERQQQIYEEYQQRKAMRRMARLCCMWLAGAAFTLAVIAGYAQAVDAAVVTSGVSLICGITGICL